MDPGRASELLFAALSEEKGIQGILETAHELLGYPLHLLDPSFTLIARVGGEDLRDPRWLEYSEHGTISEAQLLKIKKSGFVANLQSKRRAFVDPGRGGFPDVIGCDVVGGGRLLGRFGAWATSPYGEEELEIVRLVANALALEILREAALDPGREKGGDYFLSRLLSDPQLDAEEIAGIAKRLGAVAEVPVRVVVFLDRSGAPRESTTPRFIEDRLAEAFRQVRVTSFEDAVVALFSSSEDLGARPSHKARSLAAFAARNSLAVGVSRSLPDLTKVREGYRQARSALRFASDGSRLFYYEEVFALDLAYLCSKSVLLDDLVYPPLVELCERDRESSADYLRTLTVYLECSRNMVETARVLGVHYNTVKYRMDVIKASLALDLEDTSALLKLGFSLLVLQNRERLAQSGSEGASFSSSPTAPRGRA